MTSGAASHIALELASITKRFGRFTALDAARLSARRGTVHALLGENGAGKTTLMRIAFGMLRPDAGEIHVGGVEQHFTSPREAVANGIGMVHQHFTLVPAMTVMENIALGGSGLLRPAGLRAHIARLAKQTGFAIDPDARIADLPTGAQQRVEILKALSHDTQVLILDEPTAVLTPVEARELLNRARGLVDAGGTAILITHKLRDALEFADDITVLRRGATAWTGRASDATEQLLVSAMLGSERPISLPERGVQPSGNVRDIVMELDNVSVRDSNGIERLKSASLNVRRGEIVGIAAVEGNGQRELLRVLAGRMTPDSGIVRIPEVVGFIPEDRQRDALIGEFSLRDNVALQGAGSRTGLLDWNRMSDTTRSILDEYDVRANGEKVRAAALSGGNQQKLVVGREIEGSRSALVAENASRGLDVLASAAIAARFRAARDAGMAVVIHSSDLDEVLALSDRVLVVFAGEVSEVALDRDTIGRAMLGVRDS